MNLNELAMSIATKLISKGFKLSEFDDIKTTDEVVWILSADFEFFNMIYYAMSEVHNGNNVSIDP